MDYTFYNMDDDEKYCPLGFYSFFYNKGAAQRGGCHKCLKSQCQLWEELYDDDGNYYGQCAITSIAEAIRLAAEGISNMVAPKRVKSTPFELPRAGRPDQSQVVIQQPMQAPPDDMPAPLAPKAEIKSIFAKLRQQVVAPVVLPEEALPTPTPTLTTPLLQPHVTVAAPIISSVLPSRGAVHAGNLDTIFAQLDALDTLLPEEGLVEDGGEMFPVITEDDVTPVTTPPPSPPPSPQPPSPPSPQPPSPPQGVTPITPPPSPQGVTPITPQVITQQKDKPESHLVPLIMDPLIMEPHSLDAPPHFPTPDEVIQDLIHPRGDQ